MLTIALKAENAVLRVNSTLFFTVQDAHNLENTIKNETRFMRLDEISKLIAEFELSYAAQKARVTTMFYADRKPTHSQNLLILKAEQEHKFALSIYHKELRRKQWSWSKIK